MRFARCQEQDRETALTSDGEITYRARAMLSEKALAEKQHGLLVRLDRIGPKGYDVAQKLDRAWIQHVMGDDFEIAPGEEARVDAHLERVGNTVTVAGAASVVAKAPCARCLAPVRVELRPDLAVVLFPDGQLPAAAKNGEVSAEDCGVGTYHDKTVDLSQVVHDQVALGIPLVVLCKETCAGLCPQCGSDLNSGACGCVEASTSPWAEQLRSFRAKID